MADARHIHVDSDLVFSVDGDPDSACDVTKLTFYLVERRLFSLTVSAIPLYPGCSFLSTSSHNLCLCLLSVSNIDCS